MKKMILIRHICLIGLTSFIGLISFPSFVHAGIIMSAPSSLGLTSGLVGHWTFDQNKISGTSALDSSGQGNTGIITGATKTVGKLGQALKFNGTSDYVAVPQNGDYNLSASPFTISVWVQDDTAGTSLNTFHRIVSWYDGSKNIQFGLGNAVGDVGRHFYILNSGVQAYLNAASTDTSTGMHLVTATFDGASTYRMYVDGSLSVGSSGKQSYVFSGNTTTLYIGQRGDGAYTNGSLDDVRIYNRVLSATEIKRLYNIGVGEKIKNTASSAPCDSSVWYCDKANVIANNMGDGTQLVVAKVDISGTKAWKPNQNACDTPQCGQDGAQDGDNLVSNNTVDFTLYPARDACKAIGGRLPTKTELFNIYTNSASFGTFHTAWNSYWSATEYNSTNAWDLTFPDGSFSNTAKSDGGRYVRCVKPYTPSSDSLNNGLVGLWTFDGKDIYGTTAIDKSGLGNDATIMDAKKTIGKLGQGLKFNGIGDFAIVPPSVDLSGTDKISFSFWLYKDSWDATQAPAFLEIEGITGIALLGYDGVGLGCINKMFTYLAFGTQEFFCYDTPSLHAWHHYSVTVDNSLSSNEIKLYIDGQLVTPSSVVANEDTSGNFADDSIVSFMQFMELVGFANGSMDDVRLYNRVLSANEIKRLYNIGAGTKVATPSDSGSALTSGLVGHWTFDGKDIYGTTAIDKSGLGNNGTITGATKVIGRLGQALSFDGTTNYINAGSAASLDITTNGTFCSWFNAVNYSTSNGEIIKKDFNYLLRTNDARNGRLLFLYWDGSSRIYLDAVHPSAGKWHHTCATVTNNVPTGLYVDGVLMDSVGTSEASTRDLVNDLTMGNSSAQNEPFNGSIDDVRVYNRVLSANEIKRLYQQGK